MNDYRVANSSQSGNYPNGGGPLGDYAFVVVTTAEGKGDWWSIDSENQERYFGPFRRSIFATTPQATWEPRDSFARIVDGLSNQFFIGEKHIPLGRLGQCPNGTDGDTSKPSIARNMGDCTYLQAGYKKVGGLRAMVFWEAYGDGLGNKEMEVRNPLWRASDFAEDNVPTHNLLHSALRGMAFGSWHPGVCQFVMGDGAVRSVNVTTPPDTVLRALSHVSDGVSVSLP
jgi:hypothetical protein